MTWQNGRIRGSDEFGSGKFGARRDGGKRTHKGVDVAFPIDTEITAPITGRVTKIGRPYGDDAKAHFKYVEITSGGYRWRVHYIDPMVEVGEIVTVDSVIGKSQNLGEFYKGITEHVHLEIWNLENDRIDPTPFAIGLIGRMA